MTKREDLDKLLRSLVRSAELTGCAVVSSDGLIIASILPAGMDSELVGAMTSTLAGSADTVSSELSKSQPEMVIVRTKSGDITIIPVDSETVLIMLAPAKINLGFLLNEAKRIVPRLKKLI